MMNGGINSIIGVLLSITRYILYRCHSGATLCCDSLIIEAIDFKHTLDLSSGQMFWSLVGHQCIYIITDVSSHRHYLEKFSSFLHLLQNIGVSLGLYRRQPVRDSTDFEVIKTRISGNAALCLQGAQKVSPVHLQSFSAF